MPLILFDGPDIIDKTNAPLITPKKPRTVKGVTEAPTTSTSTTETTSSTSEAESTSPREATISSAKSTTEQQVDPTL